jgi:hypothetical protein
MKSIAFAVLVALIAPLTWPSASAASAPLKLRKTPNLAKNAEAYPTLVGATPAIAKINRALQAANAKQRDDMKDCRRDAPQDGYWWEQSVDAPLIGAHFVSLLSQGNMSCGGAHPNFIAEALVFDLRTGEPVDGRRLLPASLLAEPGRASEGADTPAGAIASPALTALFVDESEKEGVGADCKEAFGQQEMRFAFWPDAKAKGLAMRAANLLHWAEGPCSGPVTIPVETLKRLGVDALLIQDIETGGFQVAEP